ncbi:MAG: TonB-dependent receptor [Cellvibrio sp.]|nr:TonB-dependent receptor [Cellvibrio sp.]
MKKFTVKPLVLAVSIAALPCTVYAQNDVEEVVITGSYAQSLKNALNVKRESTGMVDSIFAEDVGKFPDQNLSESLGRIPGVAIAQDDGEGRTITVRGLGDAYSMVTVNGLQGQSLAAGSNGVRTSRAFDFNVFASELFSRLDVAKTTSAEQEDGSLGATVSLRTGRPFDYDGFTAVSNVEMGYYDGSGSTKPRASGLVSFSNDVVGFLASVAYSEKEAPLLGGETGRWNQQAGSNRFICPAANCGADATLVRSSWHPRFPRYADKVNDQDRLGVTSSFQWQIADATLLSVDGLYSKIDVTRDEPFMEAISLARNDATGMRQMSVVDYTVDNNMTLVQAEIQDADFRSEAFRADWASEFTQLSVDFSHEFSDNFRMKAFAGMTESVLDNREVTVIYEHFSSNDTRKELTTAYADASDTVTWDFTNMKSPSVEYSFDTANPANWEFSEYRDRDYDATSDSDMFRVDFEYDLAEGFTAKAGVTQKSYAYDLTHIQADKAFGAADTTVINGVATANDGNACGITPGVTTEDGFIKTAGGQTFFYPDFNRRSEFLASGCWAYEPVAGNTRQVEEEVLSYYLQLSVDTELFGNRFRGNLGVREAETDMTAGGVLATAASATVPAVVAPVVVKRDYSDTLPSLNLAYNLTDELVLRASAAEVLARPELGDLNPGAAITTFGSTLKINEGNPYIDPFRAKAYDLGLEWYYSEDALLGLTLFQKDVESFPTNSTPLNVIWSETGLPNSLLGAQASSLQNAEFAYTKRINGGGAMIEGAELSWQQQLSFLPGPDWVHGFGVQANYTYVDAERDSGSPMDNLSKDSYNFTLYWEGEKFQARISNAYRGEYYSTISSGTTLWQTRVIDDTNFVGVSASYDVNEQLKITFKGVNIFDEPVHEYETEGVARMVRNHSAGASYFIGGTYKF